LLLSTVLSSPKVFADDTTLPVLDPGNGRTKTGRLWCYAVDNRPCQGPGHPAAAYVYSEDRKADHPVHHLKGFRGLLQVDGYAGFGRLVKTDDGPQLAFCWAHTRRKFYEIHVATKSPLAAEALRLIAALYEIEADIRGQASDERRRVRQELSRPLVEAMHTWLNETLERISGLSTLAQAIRHACNHWSGLILFLEDGRVEMGRVDDWRGGGRSQGELFSGGFHPAGALSIRTVAPFPVAARQTGHADFPHPAFSHPVRPSLSAGRRVAVGR
jgi:hypothetical protein